jgi:EAL domain-containing protein (putative c-di-GMP-specific phosphodiesterase class I)
MGARTVLTQTQPTFSLVGAPFLEYLPVVDLSTGRVLGMEALVRWEHPTHGLISPARLLPHAEVSGDIGPLTRWILMEACSKARNWSPSIQLGVNCTIHQLRRGEVSAAVVLALEETGFNSGQLTLEVTEDAIVDSAASADLRTLSAMGVQLSVDDVGTNWSSFEPFKRNSISSVKIDGSFIAGLESTQGINRLVVETVIHMAHSLGMSTIVEWVETASQVEIVRAFNADAAQGFFFSLPMSSEDAIAFASGPEIPHFSRTDQRMLLGPRTEGSAGATAAGEGPPSPGVVDAPEDEEAEGDPASALDDLAIVPALDDLGIASRAEDMATAPGADHVAPASATDEVDAACGTDEVVTPSCADDRARVTPDGTVDADPDEADTSETHR